MENCISKLRCETGLLASCLYMLCFAPAWAMPKDVPISESGTPEIKIGMSYAQVKALFQNLPMPRQESDDCRQIDLADRELMLLFIDDVLARVDFYGTYYVTDKNIRVGSSPQAVTAAYGKDAMVEEDKYDPSGLNMTVRISDGLGLKFYIADDITAEVSAGTITALALVEGCL